MNKKNIIRIIVWMVGLLVSILVLVITGVAPVPQLCTNEPVSPVAGVALIQPVSYPMGPAYFIPDVIDCESYPVVMVINHFINPYGGAYTSFSPSHIEWHKADSSWFTDNYRMFILFLKFNYL
ncbi:MAG: hypothetical protein WCT49_05580 [Candidatus Paceibacterota bacterium]|jgi:hypothetical protein|nr:hypothetical protein [Candidatus Paceibacterota bacterium]